jgi:hypothetical protein
MAATRTRLDPALLTLAADPLSTDAWADTTRAGVQARDAITPALPGQRRVPPTTWPRQRRGRA